MSETVKLVTTEALRVGRRLAAEEMRERAKMVAAGKSGANRNDYDAGWNAACDAIEFAIADLPTEE